MYAAVPGRNKYRPSQKTPIPNFTLAGDWTSQRFLGSMEGAVLAGKLAAEVISLRCAGIHDGEIKSVNNDIMAKVWPASVPRGIQLTDSEENNVLAYGGGVQRSPTNQ